MSKPPSTTAPDIPPARPTPADYGLTRLLYAVDETMALLDCGRTSFYKHVADGRLTIIRDGKRSKIDAREIVALIEHLREQSRNSPRVQVPRGDRAQSPAGKAA